MIRRFAPLLLASLAAGGAAFPALAAEPLHLRALAFNADGSVAMDLKAGDWKVTLAGQEARVVSQAGPAETSKASLGWVFVLLPIQNPDLRKLSLVSIARFMETLPVGDKVLVTAWGTRGLECLTPGLTTRPSLWAAALDRLVEELPARLVGDPKDGFLRPPSPSGEPAESMAPVQTFLRKVQPMAFKRLPDDLKSRRNIIEDYAPQQLPGMATVARGALGALAALGDYLAGVPGEKHVVVFSRNEIDDLGSPVWSEAIARSGARGAKRTDLGRGLFSADRESNDLLQVQNMVAEVTLARLRVRDAFAREGITLHNVTSTGRAYDGALGDSVMASGGHTFHFTDDLPQTLSTGLGLWTQCYQLAVEGPADPRRPMNVNLSAERKGLKLIAPSQR